MEATAASPTSSGCRTISASPATFDRRLATPPNLPRSRKPQDMERWLVRIAVRNNCQSAAADGVKVTVRQVIPYKFPLNPLPSCLVRKGRSGKEAETINRLGPLGEELFDCFNWDRHSNIGLCLTETHGHMVKLNDPNFFPAGECELLLAASGENCTPVEGIASREQPLMRIVHRFPKCDEKRNSDDHKQYGRTVVPVLAHRHSRKK